jgi:hypothetical protein
MTTEINPADYDTFYQSTAGFIIPTVTGTISCASSLTIIFIILRSRRNSAYHRIMLLLSISDVLSSTAMALTTIPMPADVIYSYAGPSYGTVATCDAQALVYIIGTTSSVSAINLLNIYYLCKIVFNMEERTFSKKVEPFCFIASFPVGVIFSFFLRSNGVFNPTPYESYCSISTYPYRCNASDAVDCIRGDINDQLSGNLIVRSLSQAFLMGALGIMGLSMLTIICKVYRTEKRMQQQQKQQQQQQQQCRTLNNPQNESNDLAIPTKDKEEEIFVEDDKNTASSSKFPTAEDAAVLNLQHGLTKTVSLQAAMYLSAFILSYLFVFLTVIRNKSGEFPYADVKYVQVLKVVFQPSQGLFNMLIFIYHKLYQVKSVEKDLYSTCDALRLVFRNPGKIPERVISGMHTEFKHEAEGMFSSRGSVEHSGSPPLSHGEELDRDAMSSSANISYSFNNLEGSEFGHNEHGLHLVRKDARNPDSVGSCIDSAELSFEPQSYKHSDLSEASRFFYK